MWEEEGAYLKTHHRLATEIAVSIRSHLRSVVVNDEVVKRYVHEIHSMPRRAADLLIWLCLWWCIATVGATVQRFLERLGLQRYQELFALHEITMLDLPSLTRDDLVEMGITAVGPRKRILREVAAMDAGGDAAEAEACTEDARDAEAHASSAPNTLTAAAHSSSSAGLPPAGSWQRIILQCQQGKLDEVALRQAVRKWPADGALAHNTGVCFHAHGRLSDSITHLRRAVSINPTDLKTLSALSAVYKKAKRPAEAIETVLQAIEIANVSPGSEGSTDASSSMQFVRYDTVAVLLSKHGREVESISHFQAALAIQVSIHHALSIHTPCSFIGLLIHRTTCRPRQLA
jgi:tetratricopeptide (TPR) repeat protein